MKKKLFIRIHSIFFIVLHANLKLKFSCKVLEKEILFGVEHCTLVDLIVKRVAKTLKEVKSKVRRFNRYLMKGTN